MTDYTISSGTTSTGLNLNYLDTETVLAGGTANTTTLFTGADLYVQQAGLAENALIYGASSVVIDNGGTASDTTVDNEGDQLVEGIASGTTINGGGKEYVENGGISYAPIIQGSRANGVAAQSIGTSGTVDAASIMSSGIQTVYSTGEAIGSTVYAGGLIQGYDGGIVSNAKIDLGGSIHILDLSGQPGGIAIDSAIESGGTQIISSGGTASGTTLNTGGTETIQSGGILESAFINGGIEVVNGTLVGDIDFSGTSSTLVIGSSATILSGTKITDFAPGDTIELMGANSVTFNSATGALEFGDPSTLTVELSPGQTLVSAPISGGEEVTVEAAKCFVPGTLIRTTRGDIPVEKLSPGDRVVTPDGAETVEWIGEKSYDMGFAAKNPLIWPVRIRADAIADGVPARDMCVSAGHGIWVTDEETQQETLVPAWRLANGVTILHALDAAQDPSLPQDATLRYYHIQLKDKHGIVFAHNLESESLLDNCPGMFDNGAGAPVASDVIPLPRLEHGFALRAIKGQINARAGIAEQAEQAGPFEGYVDGKWDGTENQVNGWVRLKNQPSVSPLVDIIADGHVFTVLANAYGDDLRKIGMEDGVYRFRCDLGFTPKTLEVRLHNTQELIPFTEAAVKDWGVAELELVTPSKNILKKLGELRGFVDSVSDGVISGWAQNLTKSGKPHAAPVSLDVVSADGKTVTQVLAEKFRGDLQGIPETGFGDGYHAFEARLPEGMTGIFDIRRSGDGAALGSINVREENVMPVATIYEMTGDSAHRQITRLKKPSLVGLAA
jgi:autotransporter passenger strand-loop-strand repeat protein